jgi:hypothetical protein
MARAKSPARLAWPLRYRPARRPTADQQASDSPCVAMPPSSSEPLGAALVLRPVCVGCCWRGLLTVGGAWWLLAAAAVGFRNSAVALVPRISPLPVLLKTCRRSCSSAVVDSSRSLLVAVAVAVTVTVAVVPQCPSCPSSPLRPLQQPLPLLLRLATSVGTLYCGKSTRPDKCRPLFFAYSRALHAACSSSRP